MAAVIRKTVRARDIPPSWNVHLPGDPDAPVTVVIIPGGGDAGDVRPLTVVYQFEISAPRLR